MIALIGLSVIVIAWIVQLANVIKDKKSRINSLFIILYAIGALILVYDAFSAGVTDIAIADIVAVIVALTVLYIVKKRK